MNKDLEFLAKLDKRLRKRKEGTFTPNMLGKPFKVNIDTYTNEKINEEEIQRVLNISKKPNYIIHPINTAMGFSVGYDICEVKSNRDMRLILRFKEGQLPEEYTFKKMSKTFMSKENIKKAELVGEKIINNYEHYTY